MEDPVVEEDDDDKDDESFITVGGEVFRSGMHFLVSEGGHDPELRGGLMLLLLPLPLPPGQNWGQARNKVAGDEGCCC